jgi:hypothetical protein
MEHMGNREPLRLVVPAMQIAEQNDELRGGELLERLVDWVMIGLFVLSVVALGVAWLAFGPRG